MELNGEVDDIQAELDAALDATNGAPQPENLVTDDKPQDERLYKRDGRRFVANEEKPAAETDAKDGKAPVAADAKPDAPVKTWKPLWYKDEFGPWDKLAEPFRKALETRETESAQAITRHSTAAKAWEPISQLLAPHKQELDAAGVSEQQYVTNLVNADKFLRANPIEALNYLARTYCNGADIIAVADWMTQNGVEPKKVDPVQAELATLKQQLAQLQAAPQQQERARVNQEIESWSKDKPHFSDVRQLMSQLALAPEYKGATLDQLYDAALHAHPQFRTRIQEDQRNAEIDRARAAAATSPRGSAQPNGAARSKPTMTLEEEVAARFDGLM